jgi:hypothetical protein
MYTSTTDRTRSQPVGNDIEDSDISDSEVEEELVPVAKVLFARTYSAETIAHGRGRFEKRKMS